jgi:flagellar protein FliS
MYQLKKASTAYLTVSQQSIAIGSNPHGLIATLFKEATSLLNSWDYHRSNRDIAGKVECVNKAVQILLGLKECLDVDAGGSLAETLSELYDYCIRIIIRANAQNDEQRMKEVLFIISDLNQAWETIPPSYHNLRSVTP